MNSDEDYIEDNMKASMKNDSVKTVDLVMFMGQSNMAGRGDASRAPVVPDRGGYEFRAVSDPSKLYDIVEPFGVNENNIYGIYEPGMKTGSLVSSFVIEYYKNTKIPIVGVSASKGGSSINEWQPKGKFIKDSINRFKNAESYLRNNGYKIRKNFMVWCQGETDGDHNMNPEEYKEKLRETFDTMIENGIESIYIICIGKNRDIPGKYDEIRQAQIEFCRSYERASLVSDSFVKMLERGLMKDRFHYKQEAYNIVGQEAGRNCSINK